MQKQVDFKKVILNTLAVAGVITMAVMAPNAIQSLTLLGVGKKKKFYPSYIRRKVKELEKSGYLSFRNDTGVIYINLTPRGKKLLERYQLENQVAKAKQSKWDKQWRVIIFDIKERNRRTRNQLRRELVNFGFKKLQHSVWVTPYPCEEFIILLKADLMIGKDLLYLTTDNLEGDYKLKKWFDLE